MNRHHPYGGGYDGPGNRRGGPPGGFGPDRSHRFPERGGPSRGRGGFGRGRGGGYGAGYDGLTAYDQGPPQGDVGSYGYEPQDNFYQNGSFNGGIPSQYGSETSGAYEGYGSYEDDAGPYGQGQYGRPQNRRGGGGGAVGGAPRRERDDKVHDSIIEERINRERPCRTLFIRNIKYETNSEDVRRLFEEHGEIKTFFDLIANRGMVFVTYFDLRAAERARERLQGSEISGRPIDVHYSLPRDDHARGTEKDKNQLQGTLLVSLRNSASGQPIDDNEVRRKFQQFGDVKNVRPAGDRTDARYVEFFDSRAADEAYDRLRHQGLQDGVMDINLANDYEDQRGLSPPRRGGGDGYDRQREWDDGYSHRGRRGGGGRGGRGRGRGGGWGGDDYDRRDWGRDRGGGGGGGARGPYEDEFGRTQRPSFEDRFDGGRGGMGGGYGGPGGYGGGPPPPGPPPFAGPPSMPPYGQPPAAIPPPDERMEQAKKVQQLLAALKPLQGGGTPTSATTPSIPPVPQPGNPPPPPFYGSGPPPPLYPGSAPPYPPIQQSTNGSQQSSGAPPPANMAGLPSNIMALLHAGQSHSQQSTPPPMATPQFSMPPQSALISPPTGSNPPSGPPPPPNGQAAGYQQLMAYLAQKRS
ncbi:hypothetical protein ABKN59_002711 [Abortiporus biennis]